MNYVYVVRGKNINNTVESNIKYIKSEGATQLHGR